MKKKLSSLVLVVFMAVLTLVGLMSCGDSPVNTPQKLSTPVLTLTDNVASWGGGISMRINLKSALMEIYLTWKIR